MRNQSRIDDGEVKNAAEGMRKILSMAEPYDKIRNLAVFAYDISGKITVSCWIVNPSR